MSPRLRRVVLALAVLGVLRVASTCPVAGPTTSARVVTVRDGDSFEVEADGERQRVRIYGIDTPERGQPWSDRARRALREHIQGREVRIDEVEIDRYGRIVGEVFAGEICIACEMVRDGHAWVYRRYTDDAVLIRLEDEARTARRGLWSLPERDRVPPWRWREEARERRGD